MNLQAILVGLDLTEMDESVIRYASFICDSYKTENIYFVHVAKNLELPEEVIKEYNHMLASVDEGIERSINENIKLHFKADTKTHISVQEGHAVDKILRFAKIKNVDLIILGRKKRLKGTGVIPNSIIRKSPCSILLVPEANKTTKLKNILVPIDFSSHSDLAVENALELANHHQAAVSCVNIYEVPWGYSTIGKTHKEFAEIMLGHAKKNFENFKKKYKKPIECDYILSKDHDFTDELSVYIQATKPDLVFIGSKGKTDAAIVLLGSTAEKITKEINEIPIFLVKKKGESINIFEALLRI